MLTKSRGVQDELIFQTLEDLVPEDHLVRKLDTIDYTFIYDRVSDLYSEEGRPGIDPVILFKILTIKEVFQIRSLRQTMKEIEVNLAYRWFIRIPMSEKVPHFTVISHNFNDRFNENSLGLSILLEVFQTLIEEKIVTAKDLPVEELRIQILQSEDTKVYKEKFIYEMSLV